MGYLGASFWGIAGLAYPCGVGSAGQGGQPGGWEGHGAVALSLLCCTLFQNQVPSEGDTSPPVWERDQPEVESQHQPCSAQLAWYRPTFKRTL